MKEININWKHPKYVWAVLVYAGALFVGFFITRIVNFEAKEKENTNLKTTEYFNSDLPEASVRDEIGSKRKNVMDMYGQFTDETAVSNVESDRDSLKRKEDYSSRYTQEELARLEKQKQEELARQEKQKQEEARQAAGKKDASSSSQKRAAGGMSSDDYQLPPSVMNRYAELERELNIQRGRARGGVSADEELIIGAAQRDSLAKAKSINDEQEEKTEVVKKVKSSSEYFNTLSKNEKESSMISAMVDEEIKAQDGSRVRLRLLDDVLIGDILVKKGTYLYATMSGFSKQRVKGNVKSVMVDDAIHQINLSIYDTDGLEGLYVPSSTFKETFDDAASSAMSQNMNINNGTSTDNNFGQWAMQGVQQAYQRTSQAISKAIKTNKVRIKYGTKVFLINGKDKKKKYA